MPATFHGAKGALFLGDRLLITLRDDLDHIPFPNLWDLPGGGREDNETPEETLLREVREEVGLIVPTSALIWKRRFPAVNTADAWIWFFVAALPAAMAEEIVFGDEGQGWDLVGLEDFLAMDRVVPSFALRLRDWIADTGGLASLGV